MGIRYTQAATISFDWENLTADTAYFQDTLSGEVLQLIKTPEDLPLFYARDIATGVCFDNKCRPLNLTIYWNITGRYLGFRLPDGEFLSRYDHEPFKPEDYARLHTLLADPQLPFGNTTFEELIQLPNDHKENVDGVTGATSKDLTAYVVEGAAYTTYTLWKIIYGPSRAMVRRLTEQAMTPELLTLILHSPASQDRIWGLDQIDGSRELDTRIAGALLEIIGDEDYFPAYLAINAIKPAHLRSESFQIGLFSKYPRVNHSLKQLIIERLKQAPQISTEVIDQSRALLDNLNGEQLGRFLELYNRHSIRDSATTHAISRLLTKNNRFLSDKAYRYLVALPQKDDYILKALSEYQSAHR